MTMRKTTSLLAAAAVAVGALTLGPQASALAEVEAGTCTIQMPRYLTVKAPYTRFPVTLAADCAASGTELAAWELNHAVAGLSQVLVFDGTSSEVLEWYEDFEYFGTYFVEPLGAFDGSFNEVASQNTPTVIVKAGSRASFNTTRGSNGVVVNAGVTYYNGAADKMIPWRNAVVSIQTASNINGPFTTVATMRTGTNGIATASVRAPSKRYWRVTNPSTTSVFGSTSAPVWR